MTATRTEARNRDERETGRSRLWMAAALGGCILGTELLFLIMVSAWGGDTRVGPAFLNAALLLAVVIPAFTLLTVPPFQARLRDLEEEAHDLRADRDRLSIILENLPIIPYLADLEEPYQLRFTGPRIADLTGFTGEFLAECPGLWLERVHPDHRRRVADSWAKVRESGNLEQEYLWFVSHGEYRWFHDTLRLVRGHDGSPVGVAGTIRDITELRSAWESLGKARELLRETLRTVRDDDAGEDSSGPRWGPFAKRELEGVAEDLVRADKEVTLLRSLLPVCAHCTGPRVEPELESRAAEYMQARPISHFGATLCPECLAIPTRPRRRA